MPFDEGESELTLGATTGSRTTTGAGGGGGGGGACTSLGGANADVDLVAGGGVAPSSDESESESRLGMNGISADPALLLSLLLPARTTTSEGADESLSSPPSSPDGASLDSLEGTTSAGWSSAVDAPRSDLAPFLALGAAAGFVFLRLEDSAWCVARSVVYVQGRCLRWRL